MLTSAKPNKTIEFACGTAVQSVKSQNSCILTRISYGYDIKLISESCSSSLTQLYEYVRDTESSSQP